MLQNHHLVSVGARCVAEPGAWANLALQEFQMHFENFELFALTVFYFQ